jgi:protein phosphatase
MAARWYYTHAGRQLGPTTADELRHLASTGALHPEDRIWREGDDPARALPAGAAVPLLALLAESGRPTRLDEMRARQEVRARAAAARLPEEDDDTPEEEPAVSLPADAGPCRLVTGWATSPGRVRTLNEDSLLVQQLTWVNVDRRHELALLVVADGLGGSRAGERASGLVIASLGGSLAALLTAAVQGQLAGAADPGVAAALDAAFQSANRTVLEAGSGDPRCQGMGATASAVLAWDDDVVVRHVGDCRVYHHRGGRLTQVTQDQTVVARLVELGQLRPEAAAAHPSRSDLTQAVGSQRNLAPAAYQFRLARGDWVIVACDGLAAHVEAAALQQAVDEAPPDAARLARRLVQMANDGGGSDNCTVVAAYCR